MEKYPKPYYKFNYFSHNISYIILYIKHIVLSYKHLDMLILI